MRMRPTSRLIVVLLAISVAAAAQGTKTDGVPLRNWPIPFEKILNQHTAQNGKLAVGLNALPSNNATFIAISPCRVYDSRTAAGGPGPIPGGTSRTIPIAGGPCAGIPTNAAAFSLNFTVTGSTPSSSNAFISAYPTGSALPNTATLNFMAGSQVGNAAITPAGTNGSIDVYASLQTEVIIDINGYLIEGVGPLATSGNTANTLVLRDGTGSFSAGTITATKVLNAVYQDVAEWVPSEAVVPGTVVVLDPSDGRRVIASTHAYDTAVAGVVSENPGIILGASGSNKALIATTGRVVVLADATNAPISVGDLLVTSDVPGMAMRSTPVTIDGTSLHRPGTIIGKALQPLRSGRGKILVLLSLQ